MAITSTTLSADLSATALSMTVASGTGFPTAGDTTPQSYIVRIDDEYMVAVLQPTSGSIKLRSRGYYGTAAAAHDTLSRVLVSASPADFSATPVGADVPLPPYRPDTATIGEDVTFTSAGVAATVRDTIYSITKATAAAITLVAPSKAQDGIELTFTSQTAAAHVITATSLLGDGASGSPHTTATFAAFIGASLTLKAQNGIWNVVANVGVTIT
ncbi:MAG TPA: hypothetical protein VF573_27325 [Paraburkholderia sp.]|uniref:hypothetical protein n=1 Tax=Paraburkholderia sp. TaxID=1926495 RepID=UPI002ED00E6B